MGVSRLLMIKKFIKDRIGSIIFYAIVLIFVVYAFVSIQVAKSNAITRREYEYEPPATNVDRTLPNDYKKIAESKNLELYFDETKGNIQVKNTDTGYVWKSVVEEEDYPISKLNKQWNAYLQSIFTISYNDIDKRDAPPATAYAGRDCDFLEVNYLDNGVEVRYGFTTIGIFVKIQYLLEDGRFVVRIPYDGYEENMQFCITTLEVMPYFGAAGNDVDGYLFYPDGSGAITTYANVTNRSSKVKQGILRTYSNKKVAFEELYYEDNYDRYVASMPVFGIKNNNDALLAVVTEGAEETGIMTYPSGIVVDLNRICFDVYVRSVFDVDMFNVSSGEDTVATGREIQRIDAEITPRDREFTFFFLSGDDANYSKMADTYREYLIETDQLVDTIEDGSKLPLALEFLMGVTEPQMVTEKYITMTSFEHLIEIMERLTAQGVESSKVLLTSWQKDGVNYPEYWPVARQLGGKKGLEKLNDYLKQNTDHDVFLENNFNLALKENGGFSATKDVVYSGVNIPITAGFTNTWYLLNPLITYNNAMDFVDKISSYDKISAGYEDIGKVIYPDYNKNAPYSRSETVAQWKKLLADTKAKGKKVAVEGSNQYVYSNADYLYSVPLSAFGLAITDYSVPFIQMVLSGLIPYSSMAGNLSYDLDIQKLQWIEFGALPYFRLTYEDALLLKETEYNSLFTSTFDVWEDRVVTIYNEFKENLGSVYGQQMILHEILDDGVVRVGYEDGTLIYLNYNNEDANISGLTIPAKDYIITSQEVE